MLQLSSFLKKKKIIFFAFLSVFICLSLLSIPHTAKADAASSDTSLEEYSCPGAWGGNSWNPFSNAGAAIYNAGASGMNLFANLPWILAKLSGTISNYGLDTMNKQITTTAGGDATSIQFAKGWISVRDLANMLIVLGFVVVGIATALRIKEYDATKFLGKLIIIALLINFSGLFCGLIIDASTLTMHGLLSGGASDTSNVTSSILNKIDAALNSQRCNAATANKLGLYFLINIQFGLVYLLMAICFLYLGILMIVRYAMLGLLFILSPIAFAFWAFPFPKAKGLYDKWWESFIKWSFVGVSISFFLNIGLNILTNTMPTSSIQASSGALDLIQSMSVPIAIIIVGMYLSAKSSGVAAAIMGIATGAVGMAMGAVAAAGKGGLKMLDQKALNGNVTGAAQKTSSYVGRLAERAGFRPIGTTASANSKDVENQASLMKQEYTAAKASGDTATVDRIQQLARNGRDRRGAAAMKVITDAKDLREAFTPTTPGATMNTQQTAQRLEYAESLGGTGIRKAAETLHPELARHNDQAVQKIMTTRGLAGPAGRAQAEELAIVDANNKLSVPQRRDLNPNDITEHSFAGDIETTLRTAELMSDSQRAKIRSVQTDPAFIARATALHGQLTALGMTREASNLLAHMSDPRIATL